MAADVFAVSVFFIVLRECLECTIVVAILFSVVKQSILIDQNPATNKRLFRQIWYGVATGVVLVLIIGGGFLGAYYGLGQDIWGQSEDIWEGVFSLIATVIITAMGAALLRVSKMKERWQVKIAKALEAKPFRNASSGWKLRAKTIAEKYALFILPLITVLREGLEAVVFVGGVGLSYPATSFPLPVVTGLIAGIFVGYLIYKGSAQAKLQYFLIASTCILYLVAAGLFSKAVWDFEINVWNNVLGGDAAEVGSGPGSYDIRKSVWHVNCCNAEVDGGGGWGIFNAILGWQNSPTYGSVISYNLYWLVVIIGFEFMNWTEQHGRYPFMKSQPIPSSDSEADAQAGVTYGEEGSLEQGINGVDSKEAGAEEKLVSVA